MKDLATLVRIGSVNKESNKSMKEKYIPNFIDFLQKDKKLLTQNQLHTIKYLNPTICNLRCLKEKWFVYRFNPFKNYNNFFLYRCALCFTPFNGGIHSIYGIS